jgi:hypothetical protein
VAALCSLQRYQVCEVLRSNKTGALSAANIRMRGMPASRPSDRRERKRHQKYQLSHDPLLLFLPGDAPLYVDSGEAAVTEVTNHCAFYFT